MRFFLPFLLAPILSAGPVTLFFSDIEAYYGESRQLGDFYNGGPGGDYGIYSIGGFRDAFVVGGVLHFPLHGPGKLTVEPGFHGKLTFQYNGYMPWLQPPNNYASLVLKYQGAVVQEIRLPTTDISTYRTETIMVNGVADEIDFGLSAEGIPIGNAGDLTYSMIELNEIKPIVVKSAPAITEVRAAPTKAIGRPQPQAKAYARVTR